MSWKASRMLRARSARMIRRTLDGREQLAVLINDLDGVAAGLARHTELYAWRSALAEFFAVHDGGLFIVLHTINDVGDFVQTHRRAITIRHHHGPVFHGTGELAVGEHVICSVGPEQSAGGDVDVPALDGVLHLV